MSSTDGLSIARNPVAYALAALALVGPDLYRLADIGVDQLFAAVNLDQGVEVVLARILVTLIGFALGAVGVQRATVPVAKLDQAAGDADSTDKQPFGGGDQAA